MSRLPAHFHQGYLGDDAHRFSSLPAELAGRLDRDPSADEAHALSGWVVQLENPRELAGAVGPVVTSVVPAILDEIIRRLPSVREACVLNPFALFVIGVEREVLAQAMGRFRRLLHMALADYLDAVSTEAHGGPQAEAELAAEDVIALTSPRLRLYPVRFVIAAGDEPRGKRLLSYLLDQRSLLEPGGWDATITL